MSLKAKSNIFADADVPPPITEATRHGIYPQMSHDERSRFNFEACLYKTIATEISPGNALAYEKRVLPAFKTEHGHEPKTRHDVRKAMNKDPLHNFWGALRRNTMEMRQVNGQHVTLRQLDSLANRAKVLNEGSSCLALDASIKVPPYIAAVDHHCMPGSYHRELVEGDVSSAANYDAGFFVTTGGTIGGLCDGAGKAVAEWLKQQDTNFKPKRILDIGCALGNSLLPIAEAFPQSEVLAIDISGPMLRYGHARAKSMGNQNITFMQMSGEDLSAFEDGSFDFVMTSIFLHELSNRSLPKIIGEAYRVLSNGGAMLHLEQPQYTDEMPVYEQFIRDWDCYNNNEPFWSAMHEINLVDLLQDVGFSNKEISHASLKASGANLENEEHGRAPAWHAYVAKKR